MISSALQFIVIVLSFPLCFMFLCNFHDGLHYTSGVLLYDLHYNITTVTICYNVVY